MQLYAPLVLLHTASTLQLCVPVTHSSISEKEGSFYLEVSFIICFDGAVLNKPCKYPGYSVHLTGNNCNMFPARLYDGLKSFDDTKETGKFYLDILVRFLDIPDYNCSYTLPWYYCT